MSRLAVWGGGRPSGEWRVESEEWIGVLSNCVHHDIFEFVSRIDRLAEINGLDGKDLCTYAELSGCGEIWDYITDATVGVLYSS